MCFVMKVVVFSQEIPGLPRLDECIVSGKAFADLLMVKEFIENFGEAIDIGMHLKGNRAKYIK